MKNPVFNYAVTENIINHCPFILENKEIKAEDFIPTRVRPKDTGYDVRCAENGEIRLSDNEVVHGLELKPGCYFKMKLGFRFLPQEGWWLNLVPRSGTFINKYIHALYGVIDETYENEFCFVGQFIPNACELLSTKQFIIPFGARIAQVVVVPRYDQETRSISNVQMDEMYKERNADRKLGDYGSSGIA